MREWQIKVARWPDFRSYVFAPLGFRTMAPLRYAAKFDPFLSLDCSPTPSTLAQSKERKGSNFAIWQPCFEDAPCEYFDDEEERMEEAKSKKVKSKYLEAEAKISAVRFWKVGLCSFNMYQQD